MPIKLQYSLIAAFVLVVLIIFIYKYKGSPRDLFNLFFRPKTFITLCVEHGIKNNCNDKSNPGFKERYEKDEKWRDEIIGQAKVACAISTQKLRARIWFGFVTVFLILFSALGIAYIVAGLFSIPSSVLATIQIASAFLILWSIIGKLGYPIETIGGESLPELTDNFWYIVLNIAGIFSLFFTQFYSFFKK